jgi:uncharacterized lipoprotein YbaY
MVVSSTIFKQDLGWSVATYAVNARESGDQWLLLESTKVSQVSQTGMNTNGHAMLLSVRDTSSPGCDPP